MLPRIKILKDTYMTRENITYEHSYEDKRSKRYNCNLQETAVLF